MKIALVHDDLVQWGGAERVFATIADTFPDAPIYTSVVDWKNPFIKNNFSKNRVKTSFIQQIPFWTNIYKALLPLYPIAFEQFDFSQYDLVISSTTRFAKVIITKPETKHICYCHTPPRFLWGFSGQLLLRGKGMYFNFLRRYDLISSKRVDLWLAGSANAQQRLKQIYNVDSEVLYPFVDLERFAGVEPFKGGYLLVISRLNRYKRVDLAVEAAKQLGWSLKIVGTGPELKHLEQLADSSIEFLGAVEEKLLTQLLAGCKALVVVAEEDFGLTPLEAQALGKPVVAYKKGGALETVIDGQTGVFFDQQTTASLVEALLLIDKRGYNEESCLEQAQKFSQERFVHQLKDAIQFH